MKQAKGTLAVALFVAALFGGLFLSGWLALLLLGRHGVPLHWNIWWQYHHQVAVLPQYLPYAGKITFAGAVGFGLPLLLWLVLLVPLLRRKPESLHGDARFANLSDLRRAGLLTQSPQGLLMGRYRGRYLWLNGAQHAIAISPTRSGKTSSIAIPVLLSYAQSVVVLDVKGELFKATSGWRAAQGHAIRVWAHYDDAGRTHRFNPLSMLADSDPGKRLGEIQTIAATLYPDEPGKDPFWTSQSRAAFAAFTACLFEAWDTHGRPDPNASPLYPSLERVLRFSSGTDGHGIRDTLQQLLASPAHRRLSPQTRTVFGNLLGLADQTFSSVIATVQAPLQQFLSPILAAATNATDFDVAALRKRPTTLYVVIPTNKLDESSKLLNIFFSTVIGANLGKQLGEEPELRYQLLMLMDEFTAMGRVDVWARRISISASYSVRDLCIVQSRAQLRSAYGDHDAQNFITNHGAQIVFAPREQSDANEYSEMLGYKTLRRKQRSESRGRGRDGHQVSIGYTEEKRALFLPQEIKELPQDEEIIFYEGCRPICARKNWYFKDKALRQRAGVPPVQIQALAPEAAPQRIAVRASDAGWRVLDAGQ